MISAALLALVGAAFAEEPSTPFIDAVKKRMAEQGESQPEGGESYIEREKKKLGVDPQGADPNAPQSQGYIDAIKAKNPEYFNEPEKPTGYLEQEKAKLGPPQPEESAIAKVQQGRSELHERKEGDIHHAAGLRIGASVTRGVTGGSGRDFTALYGAPTHWVPDIAVTYEYQPWHSEWFGSLGFVGGLGAGYNTGTGSFAVELPKPTEMGGGTFGTTSRTQFRFFTLPLFAGLNYRLNLLRIVRPYAQATPALIGFYEARSDGRGGHKGLSKGLIFNGGINIPIGWLDKEAGWSMYAQNGVKGYYLTVDYMKMTTFSGSVRFANSAISLGLGFEF